MLYFNFFFFLIFGRKPKKFRKNSEAWILIQLQCVIYQWIRLDKFYKHMESFFFNFEFLAENSSQMNC